MPWSSFGRPAAEMLRLLIRKTAWEMDQRRQGANAVLVMNYSTDVIQRVTRLNLEIHRATDGVMDAMAHKLVRDAIIWSHLAGDTSQRRGCCVKPVQSKQHLEAVPLQNGLTSSPHHVHQMLTSKRCLRSSGIVSQRCQMPTTPSVTGVRPQ